jgi:hypothetical protein
MAWEPIVGRRRLMTAILASARDRFWRYGHQRMARRWVSWIMLLSTHGPITCVCEFGIGAKSELITAEITVSRQKPAGLAQSEGLVDD